MFLRAERNGQESEAMVDQAVSENVGAVPIGPDAERPDAERPDPETLASGAATGRWTRLLEAHPLLQRATGYSAGSLIAAATSEVAFAVAYGWGHSGTTLASAAGFFGGAVPNYILNRRWAWREDRRGRSFRAELFLYFAISLASFAVSAITTGWAEDRARALTFSEGWQVVLVALAFLAVSAVFFIGKFVAYEVIVFTKASSPERVATEDGEEGSPTPGGHGSPEPSASAPVPGHGS